VNQDVVAVLDRLLEAGHEDVAIAAPRVPLDARPER
jgi:hypothetical protein